MPDRTVFQYAVKVVCGEVGVKETSAPVAPGRYWTATNVHNPDERNDVPLGWKLAIAQPGKQGPISTYQQLTLGPDGALEIDCGMVMKVAKPLYGNAFVKGFVVIESPSELDVVAVYTGSQGGIAPLTVFHTERVQARKVLAGKGLG
jgi:hypothetical protein